MNYNLVVYGDEVVNGYGDDGYLGAIRRILRQEPDFHDLNLSLSELGIKGADSGALVDELSDHVKSRFKNDEQNRLIVFMPNRDVDVISVSRSRLNLANIIDRLTVSNLRILVVGPPPRNLDDNLDIQTLSKSLHDVCARRNVQYVDLFTPLEKDSQWIQTMMNSDGAYPDKVGYGLIAWLIMHQGFLRFIKW
jgi:lysophospholipase L1-like esterase